MKSQMNALLFILIGSMSCGTLLASVVVQRGDEVLLYCDCSTSMGVLVIWYRNCSHSHQPTLKLKLRTKYLHNLRNDPMSWMIPFPRFTFVKNVSSNSYDLLISNITESDEGLYFCGTETPILQDVEGSNLQKNYLYAYGNTSTQVIFQSSKVSVSQDNASPEVFPSVSWAALVPVAAVLFSNACLIVLFHYCLQNDDELHMNAQQEKDCFLTSVVFETIERKNQWQK